MLYRKIENTIEQHFRTKSNKVLILDGARQTGKTFIVRHVGKRLFKNFVEINLHEDKMSNRNFENATTTNDFYLRLSIVAGDKLREKENTLVFLDEIQEYPHLLSLLKYLQDDGRFTYIASGSLLGVTLAKTSLIPMGSIEVRHLYPLDFEEFLIANGVGGEFIKFLHEKFLAQESLDESLHHQMMDFFKKYLIVGGLPDAVNNYLAHQNVVSLRKIQREIHELYAMDASKYDDENRLKIRRVFDMVPSNLENKKKRIVAKDIENKKGKRMADYQNEFDYLISSGTTLEVKAISKPAFPLIESSGKNLLKLYLNDVGILTSILYRNNDRAILDDECSVNLGTVYESVVAQELKAHGDNNIYYYDNKTHGEVDFLIDDYKNLSVLPIEIKSGKDYTVHSALDHFISTEEYHIKQAFVLNNTREVVQKGKITYLPIYYVMFFVEGN